MASLETRVPPAIWWVIAAGFAWLISAMGIDPDMADRKAVRLAGLVAAGLGLALGAAGIGAFGRKGTTVNPHSIDRASTLVTGGIYRITRNPMYLGLLLLLAGWCLVLSSPAALIIAGVAFVVVMNRLQIEPEERMLERKFGHEFVEYRRTVRRWL